MVIIFNCRWIVKFCVGVVAPFRQILGLEVICDGMSNYRELNEDEENANRENYFLLWHWLYCLKQSMRIFTFSLCGFRIFTCFNSVYFDCSSFECSSIFWIWWWMMFCFIYNPDYMINLEVRELRFCDWWSERSRELWDHNILEMHYGLRLHLTPPLIFPLYFPEVFSL